MDLVVEPLLPSASVHRTRTTRRSLKEPRGRTYAASGTELVIYLILGAYIVFLLIRCTWNLSAEEGMNYDMYNWRLDNGYLFGRKMVRCI